MSMVLENRKPNPGEYAFQTLGYIFMNYRNLSSPADFGWAFNSQKIGVAWCKLPDVVKLVRVMRSHKDLLGTSNRIIETEVINPCV